MTNHGCQFDWCENDMNNNERFEHMSTVETLPATGKLLTDVKATIGLSLYYHEAVDPAAVVTLSVECGKGDTEVDFRLDEAIMFHDALAALIRQATAGTALDPERVVECVRSRSGAGVER